MYLVTLCWITTHQHWGDWSRSYLYRNRNGILVFKTSLWLVTKDLRLDLDLDLRDLRLDLTRQREACLHLCCTQLWSPLCTSALLPPRHARSHPFAPKGFFPFSWPPTHFFWWAPAKTPSHFCLSSLIFLPMFPLFLPPLLSLSHTSSSLPFFLLHLCLSCGPAWVAEFNEFSFLSAARHWFLIVKKRVCVCVSHFFCHDSAD